MKLSNDLVSQFVKITKDEVKKPPNTSSYGTIISYEGGQYVQLDGSDLLTPFDKTVQVKDDERVIVSIKGHGAVITGNLTDPSASNDDLINVSNDLVAFKINTEGMFFEVHNEIGNLNTKIEVTAEGIRTELSDTAKGLENKIQITAEGLQAEITDSYNDLSNKITVTAEGLEAEITDNYNELSNKISVTAGEIRTEMSNEIAGLNNTISITASGIRTDMNDRINGLSNTITTTANGIEAKITSINGSMSTMDGRITNLSTTITATAGELRTAINGKIGSSDVGTIVKQNATSWGISINGKLSGTNYTFDGTNFTIGQTNGTTTAYHSSTRSRWEHSDGSYTQVDSSGIKRYVNGSGKLYHYLQYSGEYTCNSEQQVGITLPSEFAGKNFHVITAVKRIYVALLDYIENCRFPLLSFYAEARNINTGAGYFEIYASIRAWNRTGVSGMGTVVGTNDTANETAAVKPVVAYWVYA